MAGGNVTININGTGGGGGGRNGQSGGSGNTGQPAGREIDYSRYQNPAGSSSSAPLPPDTRLMEDVRRAIINQGAIYIPGGNTYRPIINQAEQLERTRINSDITQKYEDRRADAKERMQAEYERIDREVDAQKEAAADAATSPMDKSRIEDFWEAIREARYRTAGTAYDDEIAGLDQAEKEERQEANEALTRVIEELTQEIKRTGTLDPNSYMGKLKMERQQAIIDRDTAGSEEEARAAAARVRELEERMRNVIKGDDEESEEDKRNRRYNATMRSVSGINQAARAASNGDFGSLITGVGAAVAPALRVIPSVFGIGGETLANGVEGVTAIMGMMLTLMQEQGKKEDRMAGLSALVRNSQYFGRGTIGDTRAHMYDKLNGYSPDMMMYSTGVNISDLGLSAPDFAESAERRMKQRGIGDGYLGIRQAFYQEALERVFSLDQGALGKAGQYDRYGMNATDAFSNLMAILERNSRSGVSQGNYVRAQEYLNLQQSLMGQYMNYQDRPNIGIANKEIAALTAIQGYTVDSRSAGDMQAARSTLTNPQNDRMKAILYSVVEEMNPEKYAGNAAEIDKALNDPLRQGEIMKKYFQRIENMYGDVENTNMGYFAFRSMFPNMAPDRMMAFVKGITDGQGGNIMANGSVITGESPYMQRYASQVSDYTSGFTQESLELQNAMNNGISEMLNTLNEIKDKVLFFVPQVRKYFS